MITTKDIHKEGFNAALISADKKMHEKDVDNDRLAALMEENYKKLITIQRQYDYLMKIKELTNDFS